VTALQAFFADPAGLAVQAMLVVAFTDFALGTFAAFRDGTFELDAVAAFLRKHIAGRVAPIALLVAVGYFAQQPLFSAAGLAGAGIYVAETVASIMSSWGPRRTEQPVPKD
jgi:hypothetical protein